MKSRMKKGMGLLLAMLLLCGCKVNTPPVNLGSFSVKIPGDIEKNIEQLPLTEMGIGVNTPLVMTTAQSTPNNNELYLAICVEWEQTLGALNQIKGGQLDQNSFMQSVKQNVVDLLTMGATVGESKAVKYGTLDGIAMPFEMEQNADSNLSVWPITKGQLVSFASPKRLIMLVYATNQSSFNERHMDAYFSSIIITQP